MSSDGDLTTGGRYDVAYFEVPDLYDEQWRPDASTAVRGCRVRWENRDKFKADILGETEAAYDPNTGRLVRHLPHEHPCWDGMFAIDCALRDKLGVPGYDGAGRITFDERTAAGAAPAAGSGSGDGWAVYAVTYARPNFSILADDAVSSEFQRYVVKLRKFSIENLTIPGQSFKWDSDGATGNPPGTAVPAGQGGKPIAADITKPFQAQTFIWQWLQVPSIPDTNITAALGKVNNATFDGFPAETLLLQSVEVEPKQHANSTFYWQINYHVIYRPDGWNKSWNRTAGALCPVVNIAAAEPSIYDTVNFASLFSFI